MTGTRVHSEKSQGRLIISILSVHSITISSSRNTIKLELGRLIEFDFGYAAFLSVYRSLWS